LISNRERGIRSRRYEGDKGGEAGKAFELTCERNKEAVGSNGSEKYVVFEYHGIE
jgi:hypothetical protein